MSTLMWQSAMLYAKRYNEKNSATLLHIKTPSFRLKPRHLMYSSEHTFWAELADSAIKNAEKFAQKTGRPGTNEL